MNHNIPGFRSRLFRFLAPQEVATRLVGDRLHLIHDGLEALTILDPLTVKGGVLG